MPKICAHCGQEIKKDRRTSTQNKALHKYFSLLADEFNRAGLDMRQVIKEDVSMDWTGATVKEYLWRPVQKALTQKESTTELDKLEEITKIYDTLNRHIGEKFGVFVPFPSEDQFDATR